MKKNIFLKIICFPFKCIEFIILNLLFILIYILVTPFTLCKTKGKINLNKNDEARVFVSNHYEIYGPLIVYLRFPYKFRPWVIDKMTKPETIEKHMSIGIYNNFKGVPRWLKTFIIKIIKRLVYFVISKTHPIPVSRDSFRENLKTMQTSTEVLEKGKAIFIWPEKNAVKQGVGEFMSGFEHLGKYYYQQTGKKISFYPVFISQKYHTMFIEKPIVFNPDNDPTLEKQRIVNGLHDEIEKSYEKNELNKQKKKI